VNRSAWRTVGLTVVLVWCNNGCEAPLPAPPPATPTLTAADAWTAWQEIVARGQADWDIERALELTGIMAASPDGLQPLLTAIGDGTVSAHAAVLAIVCLTPLREDLTPYAADIASLTAADQTSAIRAFGTHLLGLVDRDDAKSQVAALLDDPDRAVREAAMGVLVTMDGERVAHRLESFWNDGDNSTAIREQIVLGMSPALVEKFLPIFAEAVADQQLNPGARYKAATVLGQAGTADHISVLRGVVDSDPDPYVRERAEGGLALLRANADAPPAGAAANQ